MQVLALKKRKNLSRPLVDDVKLPDDCGRWAGKTVHDAPTTKGHGAAISYILGVFMKLSRRWLVMYCHAPFPPKPKWRIWIDSFDKGFYIDLGRIRVFRRGKSKPRLDPTRPVIPCPKTIEHGSHLWDHYDIDLNETRQVWCTGDFLTTP